MALKKGNHALIKDLGYVMPEWFDNWNVLDSTLAIQEAITYASANKKNVRFTSNTYNITSKILLEDNTYLQGDNTTFTTTSNTIVKFLEATAKKNIRIFDIAFDHNFKARFSFHAIDCVNVKINGTYHTKYSKDYGYSPFDSALCFDNCKKVSIRHVDFFEFGNQYGVDTADLNRCITLQGNSTNVSIEKCNFEKVNQGVVVLGSNVAIEGCYFTAAEDNPIYLLNSQNVQVLNNTFITNKDECIVVAGKNHQIRNNYFEDSLNKCIVFKADVDDIDISNNKFVQNTIEASNIIATRGDILVGKNVKIKNNFISSPIVATKAYPYFNFEFDFIDLEIEGNKFEVNNGNAQRIIKFGVNTTGKVRNNIIACQNSSAQFLERPTTTGKILVESNDLQKCGFGYHSFYTIVNQTLQGNVGTNVNGTQSKSVVSLNGPGIPTSGTYKKDDIVYTYNPTVAGTSPNKYIVFGYLRLTDGNTHVLNTDWVELRALTGA